MCSYTTCSWCIHGCTWPKPDKFWRIGSISAHRCTQFVQSSENSGWLTSMALSPTISLPRPPPWWSCPKSHQDQQYYLKSSYMFVTGCTQTSIILDCFMNIQTNHLMIPILQFILKMCPTTTRFGHLRTSHNPLPNPPIILLPGHLRICWLTCWWTGWWQEVTWSLWERSVDW